MLARAGAVSIAAMEQSLVELVHRNLMDVTALGAEGSGGCKQEQQGELFFVSSSTTPFLNGVMRERPEGGAAELLERAAGFFAARERGFVVHARPGDPALEQAAVAAGMAPVMERYPEMVCRAPLEALPGDVRAVASVEDAAAYWRICDCAYPSIGFPEQLFTQTFSPQTLLDADRVWACLAYDEQERAVACASLWLAAGTDSQVGFIGWVAALPQARGRGLAAACTVRATNRAFELGAGIASLQASPMGEQIYRRLGYEELYAYRLMGAAPPDQPRR
jgi:GNAT superfamily N-acetyltransferase